MRKPFAAITALIIVGAISACSGGDDAPTSSTADAPVASATAPVASDTGSAAINEPDGFARSLRLLPNDAVARSGVWIADYDLASQLLGIDRPGPGATDEQALAYIRSMKFGPDLRSPIGLPGVSPVDGFGQFESDIEGWRKTIGFTSSDVDMSIHAGAEDAYDLVLGRFSSDQVVSTVRNDEIWGELTREVEVGGIEYLAWGDGVTPDLSKRSPPLRPSGRGHRLRADEGRLSWTLTDESMGQLIGVTSGAVSSLDANPDFSLLANVMDERDVFAGYLTELTVSAGNHTLLGGSGFGLSDASFAQTLVFLNGIALDRFNAYGIGVTFDGDAFSLVMAAVFPDENAAAGNIGAARTLIAEVITALGRVPLSDLLIQPEIRNDGRVLVVKAEIKNPTLWFVAFNEADPILFHK